MSAIVTVNKELAAELLHDLAERMLSEDIELTAFDNKYWRALRRGTITINWKEAGSSD